MALQQAHRTTIILKSVTATDRGITAYKELYDSSYRESEQSIVGKG